MTLSLWTPKVVLKYYQYKFNIPAWFARSEEWRWARRRSSSGLKSSETRTRTGLLAIIQVSPVSNIILLLLERDMTMRRIFWGFCRNWFLMSPLHYLSGRSDFGFEFAEIFIRKTTPRITDTESRLLNFLKENSLYQWYGESSTPRTSVTVSRRLPVLLSRRVADSVYHQYGESTTPRIVESGSRRLRVSVIWGDAIKKK